MEIATAERLAKLPKTGEGAPAVGRSFGRVEAVEVDMSIDFTKPRPGRIAEQ